VQAMPVVRTFDTGQTTFGRYHRASERHSAISTDWYRDASFSARFAIASLGPSPTSAVSSWSGGWWTAHGQLDFAFWSAASSFGMGMAEAMFPMMSSAHMVDQAKSSIARIQQSMAIEPSAPARAPDRRPADGAVRFEDVDFGYGGKPASHDSSFTAHPVQVTASVGRSGAG
ncbi:hypothetical protein OY671_010784, partial [Metschnikowia pulcherrima]